jgi:adenylosuccinate lyase
LKAWEEEGSFKDNILQDSRITGYLGADELEGLFDVKYHLGHIDTIIKRLDGINT